MVWRRDTAVLQKYANCNEMHPYPSINVDGLTFECAMEFQRWCGHADSTKLNNKRISNFGHKENINAESSHCLFLRPELVAVLPSSSVYQEGHGYPNFNESSAKEYSKNAKSGYWSKRRPEVGIWQDCKLWVITDFEDLDICQKKALLLWCRYHSTKNFQQ